MTTPSTGSSAPLDLGNHDRVLAAQQALTAKANEVAHHDKAECAAARAKDPNAPLTERMTAAGTAVKEKVLEMRAGHDKEKQVKKASGET